MTETIRQPRSLEKRDVEVRAKAWAPPTLLPEPEPEAGFTFRWIRTSTLNTADPTNISSKFREGWVPVKADTQPQMQFYAAPEGRFTGCIEVGGLLLCKIPTEFMEQREAYYQQQAQQQMQSVDSNFMRESDARMPLFSERKTKVSFGKGT